MPQSDAERLAAAAERARSRSATPRRGATRAQVEAAKSRITLPSQRREQASESGGGGDSTVQQVPKAVFNTAKGLFTGFLPSVWDSTAGVVGGAVQNVALRRDADDIRTGSGPLGSLGRLFANEDMVEAASTGKSFGESFDKAVPIITGTARGIRDTGKVAAELGEVALTDKGFDESAMGRASKDGKSVEFLIENVGNALFAGRLASGATAAAATRAGRASPRVQRVADVTMRAEDAFDKTLLAPLTVPAKLATRGAKAAARSETGQKFATSSLGQYLKTRRLLPSTRELGDIENKFNKINAVRREDEAVSPAKRVQRILAGVEDGAGRRGRRSPETVRAAEGAMFLDLMDMRQVFGPLAPLRVADESAFASVVQDVADTYGNPSLTPEAVGMYLDKLDGTLDPALTDAIDRSKAEWVLRANEGGLTRNIDGTDVVTGSIPNFVAGTGRMADGPDGSVQRAESLTAQERIFDNVDPESATSAPARFRNTVSLGRAVDDALSAVSEDFNMPQSFIDGLRSEVLTTVDRALSTTNPAFVRGGRVESEGGGQPRATGERRVAAEYVKEGGNVPLDVDSQAMLAARDVRRQVSNQMFAEVQQKFGVDPRTIEGAEGLAGSALVKAVSDAKGEPYVAWKPSRLFSDEASGSRLQRGETLKVARDETPADAVLVPKWVADSFDYAYKEQNAFAEWFFDKPHRVWKGAVLPLQGPRWLVGNAISGSIMMHAGNVTIKDVMQEWKHAREDMRAYAQGRRSDTPREILGTSHSASERRIFDNFANHLDDLDMDELASGKARTKVGKVLGYPVRKGYDINAWTDDFFRVITYRAKRGKGMTEAEAVKEALQVMGDFDRLTPFERRIVRRATPFYSWLKHISRLTAKVATEDPARMMWNMALPLAFSPEDQDFDGPEWMKGMLKTGDSEFMSIGWAFPFATTADVNPANPLEFAFGSLSPSLTTAYEATTGNDPSFGRFEHLSTPDAEYGKNAGAPIFNNPLSLPYLVGRNFPQFNAIYDELQRRRSGGEGQRLFDTGERMGRVDPNRNLEDNLARLFGIPLPKTYNAGP